jgi:hypothetical protein
VELIFRNRPKTVFFLSLFYMPSQDLSQKLKP